jgi:hypothetical protein|tara:strand:+ start:10455 stop:11144 length:690 start_codon:yes stop_codon:yes gene_type:complete
MNIWEHNDLSNIHVEDFEDSKIYWMDDFYKNPDLVFQFLIEEQPPLWKHDEEDEELMKQTFNTKYFEDRRWDGKPSPGLEILHDKLSDIFGQDTEDRGKLVTNHTIFFADDESRKINDYKNNWWWPHCDSGYNAIVYLNEGEDGTELGTNLYKSLKPDLEQDALPEHARPWVDKSYWKRIAAFKSKYNRLVAFDGFKYKHGMSIENDKWCHETRVNQVLFFTSDEYYES